MPVSTRREPSFTITWMVFIASAFAMPSLDAAA